MKNNINNKFNSIINHFINLYLNEKDLFGMTIYFPIDWEVILDNDENVNVVFIDKTPDGINNIYTMEINNPKYSVDELFNSIERIINFNRESLEIKLKFEEMVKLEQEKYEEKLKSQQEKMINELKILLNSKKDENGIINKIENKPIVNINNDEEIKENISDEDDSDEITIIKN